MRAVKTFSSFNIYGNIFKVQLYGGAKQSAITKQIFFQCSGVVTTQDKDINWCCLMTEPEIHHSKPGDMILYHKSITLLKYETGRTGQSHEEFSTGREGPNSDACATGWAGENCNVCDFGFSTESNCNEFIQNGEWTMVNQLGLLIAHLTFDGPDCANLVPGMYWITFFQNSFVWLANLDKIF